MSNNWAYYNEFNPYCVQWLKNLIKANLIAPGEVDGRSIVDVSADDVKGFRQHHFFAGIGGWSVAARLAGWPDSRELCSGSAPCQPFSNAGKKKGMKDERHLWPEFKRIIEARRFPAVVAEQVADAIPKGWLDVVLDDLEALGYTTRPYVVPARAVGAFHQRKRLWIVADRYEQRTQVPAERNLPTIEVVCSGEHQDGQNVRRETQWGSAVAVLCHDGVKRYVEPSTPLLGHGIPFALDQTRAFGNAIVPQVGAALLSTLMEFAP